MEHGRTRRCWFWNPAWQRPTGSINSSGHFQSTDTNGYEVHVKDLARFPDTHGWAFFEFEDSRPGAPGRLFPRNLPCYSCHEQHGAVDTTFLQFYPTLLPIAKSKQTLSPEYRKHSELK